MVLEAWKLDNFNIFRPFKSYQKSYTAFGIHNVIHSYIDVENRSVSHEEIGVKNPLVTALKKYRQIWICLRYLLRWVSFLQNRDSAHFPPDENWEPPPNRGSCLKHFSFRFVALNILRTNVPHGLKIRLNIPASSSIKTSRFWKIYFGQQVYIYWSARNLW